MISKLIKMTLFWVVAIYLGNQAPAVHAFPSLFLPRLFQQQPANNNNNNIGQQAKQQQQQQHQHHHHHHQLQQQIPPDSFPMTANTMGHPVTFDTPYGSRQLHPNLNARPQHHHHHHVMSSDYFDSPQSDYFKPAGSIAGNSAASIPIPVEQHQAGQLQHNPHGQNMHPMASFHEPASIGLESTHMSANTNSNDNSNNNNNNSVESTVDKIENHIGNSIEQSLKADEQLHQRAASEFHQHPSEESSGEEHKPKSTEKESTAAASGEESEEASEGPVVEKRHEKHHEEEKHGEQKQEEQKHHEQHHHHEHTPEAFEVHHKKGGKSFQYFHQGHHP